MKEFKLLHKYQDILHLIDEVDAVAYAHTRNYTDGAVSYLSPYISRGMISLPFIKERILKKYSKEQAHTFIFELAWREFFRRQWDQLGERIWSDIKQDQAGVQHRELPDAMLNAATGIEAIDDGIRKLYADSYMHNHVRMYVASIACNIGHAHWREASRWMYYHLADHDIASNTLSWQWVAGTFSSKKYYCDQSNINKYCRTGQRGTFLDVPYEKLPTIPVPEALGPHSLSLLSTHLPSYPVLKLDHSKPLLLYNAYHLDPTWRSDMDAHRILLLEPSHYAKYPVSEKVLNFILSLSENIDGIQVFCGEVNELFADGDFPAVYSQKHPLSAHYPGTKDEPEWMFPYISKVKGSFMSYWKECERCL